MNTFFLNRISNLFCLLIFLFCSIEAKEVNKEQAKTVAQNFISSKFPELAIDSIAILSDSKNEVIGYVAVLKPTGFIVISNNTEISPIISYSEKSKFYFVESSDNILLDLNRWDLEIRNKNLMLNLTNDLAKGIDAGIEWNNYLLGNIATKSVSQSKGILGPLLTTNWYQSGIYNQNCPKEISSKRSLVGCVATAAGQILNYWQFPKKMFFSNGTDDYSSEGKIDTILIPDDAATRDFPTFSELNSQLNTIKYDGSETEIGNLCLGWE